MSKYLILEDADVNDFCECCESDLSISGYYDKIELNTVLDELKFEIFIKNINKKTFEEIYLFFNK